MSELDKLIEVQEASVEKNGERPLTNKWLLNILKVSQNKLEEEEDDDDDDLYDDANWLF